MITLAENSEKTSIELNAMRQQAQHFKEEISSLKIQTLVANAADILPLVWPLKTFIACNPLHGLEILSFEDALAKGERFFATSFTNVELEAVNRELIKWCQAFLDEGQATIIMPEREKGFYCAWATLAPFDKRLHSQSAETRKWLSDLPAKPEDALLLCLEKLKVDIDKREDYLRHVLAQLPGWAGYIKRHSDWQNKDTALKNPINLVDFLAVRLAITCALWPDAGKQPFSPRYSSEGNTQALTLLEEREEDYRQHLLNGIMPQAKRLVEEPTQTQRPDAQLVFCIDVRSEPLRYRIEQQGNYETLGFAGFFGLPVRLHNYNNNEASDSCPVLIKPRHDVYEQPIAQNLHIISRHQKGKEILRTLKAFYQDLKYNFATPFALVETLGAWCGLWMLWRTLAPTSSVLSKGSLIQNLMPSISTKPIIQTQPAYSNRGIEPDEQALYAETALRMMGLIKNFGLLIILCGHGSTTQNNPYASALDCGACGGNHGGSNAKILAEILNTQGVRTALKKNGITIPEDTLFIAAEHDTTTDEVSIYENVIRNNGHCEILKKLETGLTKAKEANNTSRCRHFGLNASGSSAVEETFRRSCDWAEIRPEWGLARNAAFIIGPRLLTKDVDLEGRCFLHSYDWKEDENEQSLETILTAPMVVAEWINTQYFFSSIDNVAYGSGSKITHNITGKLGIMQGNASDLMHGLPLQSVKSGDDELYHEPLRLQTVVYAPRQKIDSIIARQPILKTLFFNRWVILVAIDPQDNKAYLLDRNQNWQAIANAEF